MANSTLEKNEDSLSLRKVSHRHEFLPKDIYMQCSCGKKKLKLNKTNVSDLLVGKKNDGSRYSVRTDRRRYFFPGEWEEFIKQFSEREHRFFFMTLLHTGARIMEALHLKYKDIDYERGTVHLRVVKQKASKKNTKSMDKSRRFFIASNFIKEYKSFVRNNIFKETDYIFLNNDKLPENYEDLDNKDKKKYYQVKAVNYSQLLKRKIKKTNIEDYHNFSPHNIRKTYGMWMRNFISDSGELCYRMGHDLDTFMAHYGSSLMFTENEIRKINKILGDVK